jgi:hypothetical protein
MLKKFLLLIFISFIITGCNREENNERRALSHCADIKYINYMNSNPQLIVNKAKQREFIDAIQERDVAVRKWMKENNTTKDLMGGDEAEKKFDNLADPINFKLFSLFSGVFSEASDIQALNEKTVDYKIEYKKKELTNYAKFHLQCWNIYKSDNGYYSKQFIDKYLKWQKQDVSNLSKQSHDFLDEMLQLTRFTSYSKGFTDHFEILISILAPKN